MKEVTRNRAFNWFLKFTILAFISVVLTANCEAAGSKKSCSGATCGLSLGSKPQDGSLSCRTMRTMARVYMAYGKFDKAQGLAGKALELAQQRNESDEELSLCLLDLAYIYNELGRFSEAEQMCNLGIQLQEKIYYDEHPYVAYSLRTLSSIYQGQGQFAKARSTLEKAMGIMLRNHPSDKNIVAPFQIDYARLLVAENKLTEAEEYYDKAVAAITACYGPDNLYTATVMSNVAELYTLQGRFKEAETIINKSQPIQEKVYGPDHQFVAGLYLTRARICQAQGSYSEAEKLFKKARNAVQKTGNLIAVARLEERIEQIRSVRADSFGPVAALFNAFIYR